MIFQLSEGSELKNENFLFSQEAKREESPRTLQWYMEKLWQKYVPGLVGWIKTINKAVNLAKIFADIFQRWW